LRDTIYALSSGNPPAAIAVVRISGPDADAALIALGIDRLPTARRASLRTLAHGGHILDHALVLRFPGPDSATGEDLAELHLHGGRATIAAIYTALASQPGLRLAEPGEFTRRAFENGRIDLSAAEGLADLLRAETEGQRRAALSAASGGLTPLIEQLTRAIVDASARVEAAIDFDDEDDVLPWPERAGVLGALASQVRGYREQPPAERLRDGIRVVVAGPPNAGKSSLINYLSSRDVAIVAPLAGTTRDVIEAPVVLRGLPLIFVDTAGLRDDPADPVEVVGVERARGEAASGDLLLWLGAPEEAPDTIAKTLIVRSKRDRAGGPGAGEDHSVSSVTGEGMAELVDAITARAAALLPKPDQIALNQRQRACLHDVEDALHAAAMSDDLILVAEHLRLARVALDRLTGRAGVEAMLDSLFGTFCIGK